MAIEDYTRAIELDPEDAGFYINRGIAYGASGNLSPAIRDLDEAIRLRPEDAIAYYNRGTAYSEMGERNRAI